MQHLQINIRGKIKNTGYLHFIKQIAFVYGIKGYVKYMGDDTVLLSAEGKARSMQRFIELTRTGSYNSRIDHYKTDEIPFEYFKTFEIL